MRALMTFLLMKREIEQLCALWRTTMLQHLPLPEKQSRGIGICTLKIHYSIPAAHNYLAKSGQEDLNGQQKRAMVDFAAIVRNAHPPKRNAP